MKATSFLQQFENGDISAANFGHTEHVRAAWEMLGRDRFLEAASRYSLCIERLAQASGAPEKFNLTVTLSFLSLIAERMEGDDSTDFDQFYARNPELAKNPLLHWYSKERLNCNLARKVFLMPEVSIAA